MAYTKLIRELPPELRGPPRNRWVNRRTRKLRAYRANTCGEAKLCRTFTDEQRKAWGRHK